RARAMRHGIAQLGSGRFARSRCRASPTSDRSEALQNVADPHSMIPSRFRYRGRLMSLQHRNNVHVSGKGKTTMFLAHGFGCDQNMWRLLEPTYAQRYRIVLFDLVGSGGSDLAAYDRKKYSTLHGYADDVCELVAEYADGPAIFVGHSVS